MMYGIKRVPYHIGLSSSFNSKNLVFCLNIFVFAQFFLKWLNLLEFFVQFKNPNLQICKIQILHEIFYQERIVRRRHFRFAYDIFHNLLRIELPTKTQCVIYLLAIKYWGKFFKWTVKLILSYPGGGLQLKINIYNF